MKLEQLTALVRMLELDGVILSPAGKKLETVRASYGVPPEEEVLALIDATVFGSAKNGLAVTPRGVYWRNDRLTPTVFSSLTHEQLLTTGISSGWMCIKFAGGGEFDTSGATLSTSDILKFLEGIRELAAGKELPPMPCEDAAGTGAAGQAAGGAGTDASEGGHGPAGTILSLKERWRKLTAEPLAKIKDMYANAKEFISYTITAGTAKHLAKESPTLAEANALATRLIRESAANGDETPEIRQTNDAIIRIAALLDEIANKCRKNTIKNDAIESILEESSLKNLNIARRLADKNFYVGILGEFSCGKSTFINAMLEERFLIEDVLQGTTCSKTTVKYAPDENIMVIFNNDTYITMRDEDAKGKIEEAEKKQEFLRLMTAEEERAKKIREVIWQSPIDVLQNGLAIVDTPGIGSQNPRHTEVARLAAQDCDALLVLTNLDKPLSQELTEAVRNIAGKEAANCIFIGTRKDQLPPKELNRMRRHFQKRLFSQYGHECQFEFVSAYKALEALQSGAGADLDEFREFRMRIKHMLESNRQYIQRRKAAALINEIACGIAKNLETQLTEFTRQTKDYEENVVGYDSSDWAEWAKAEVSRYKDSNKRIKTEALTGVSDFVDRISRKIHSEINAFKDTSDLKKYLQKGISSTLESYSGEIQNLPSKLVLRPLQELFSECQQAYGKRFKKEYKKIENIFGQPVMPVAALGAARQRTVNVTANKSGLDRLHDEMESEENFKIGGGMATGIGLSLLVPGVGWVAGATLAILGGVLGAGWLKSLDKRKAEACNKVDESMHEFEKKLRANIEENYSLLSVEIGKQLSNYIQLQKDEYKATIDGYNQMLATQKENLLDMQQYIKLRLPELNHIAEEMNNQKQKEYFVSPELDKPEA